MKQFFDFLPVAALTDARARPPPPLPPPRALATVLHVGIKLSYYIAVCHLLSLHLVAAEKVRLSQILRWTVV